MTFVILFLCGIFSANFAYAQQNDFTRSYDRVTKTTTFIFRTEKGDVYFNHDKHQKRMKEDSCTACHKTDIPTKENTLSKLDPRKAHYFCKGCHKAKGRGPTECHECHRTKK
jgi:hypothetical protein